MPAGDDLGIHDVPARRIGVMGGDKIDFGSNGSVALEEATTVWREAIPRRMNQISSLPAKPGETRSRPSDDAEGALGDREIT